jgi:hypothetical protein
MRQCGIDTVIVPDTIALLVQIGICTSANTPDGRAEGSISDLGRVPSQSINARDAETSL